MRALHGRRLLCYSLRTRGRLRPNRTGDLDSGGRLRAGDKMRHNRRRPYAALAPCAVALGAGATAAAAAHAETLADALSLAYQSNPTLQQARAQQRALDEDYVQARTGWRPTVTVTASEDYEHVYANGIPDASSGGATLTAAQPIYTGGRTTAAVRAAEAAVLAGRESLRQTEATVLQSVVQAYEDVLRDQTTVGIQQDDVQELRRVLDEVSAKREVGQITRTDVVQVQAQLAAARASLTAAQAQLQVSRAEYTAAVGQNPGTLVPPPPLPQLPGSVDKAFDIADSESPSLRQAELTEQSSRSKIQEARANFLPSVSIGASIGYIGTTTPAQEVDYSKAFTAQATVTQPIFTGGLNGSMVRQAIEQNTADRIGVERTRRSVVQAVSQAWDQMTSSAQQSVVDQEEVDAATLEFEGMQQEYRVALRTTLEVLSASETLIAARVSQAQAIHDTYVAQANLLEAIGRLEARYLLTGTALYDPKKSFDHVRNAGAPPYEPLIAGLDGLGYKRVASVKPIPAPPPPNGQQAMINGTAPDPNAPLATALPVVGAPATVSPSTPATVGTATGGAAQTPAPPAVDQIQQLLDKLSSTGLK